MPIATEMQRFHYWEVYSFQGSTDAPTILRLWCAVVEVIGKANSQIRDPTKVPSQVHEVISTYHQIHGGLKKVQSYIQHIRACDSNIGIEFSLLIIYPCFPALFCTIPFQILPKLSHRECFQLLVSWIFVHMIVTQRTHTVVMLFKVLKSHSKILNKHRPQALLKGKKCTH